MSRESPIIAVVHRIFLLTLSIVFLFSCKPKKNQENTTAPSANSAAAHFDNGRIYASVNLSPASSEAVALYLPPLYKQGAQFPVLLLFDPHGDGNFVVSKYQSLADEYGFILLGSNTAKNGMTLSETSRIADNLILDISSHFQIGNGLISLAGFSGGARTALLAAENHPELCAVVYGGAAMPPEQVKPLPPALGIAGRSDMNYTEVIGMDAALSADAAHCLIEWKGKHEWPDTSVYKDAFRWCLFSAMKKNYVTPNDEIVQQFVMENLASLPNTIDDELRMRKIVTFATGLADVASIEAKHTKLVKSDAYKKALGKKKDIFDIETSVRHNYAVGLEEQSLDWWQNEIARIRKVKTGSEQEMYNRLLSYISLACYSYANSAVSQGNAEVGKKILSIYKLADPDNADRPYLEAVLYAKLGDDARAVSLLQEAAGLGFKDKAKMANEESFSRIKGSVEFRTILSKISS